MHRFPSLALGFCLSWSLTLRPADAVPPDPVDPDPTDAALLDQERDEIVGSEDFQPVRVALLEGRGADAARELETLLGKGENEDLFWMLQATAWRLGGDDERALAVLEKILEDRGGAFRHKAAFMKADILAREKRFREAVEIYSREILRLTSADRKRELAGIYIRFADSYFEGNGGKAGGEGGKAKAYDKARDFYTRSLDVGPGDEEAARVRFRIGRCLYEEKKFAAAVKYFEAELRTRSTGPRADEMAYYLGLAKLSIGDAVGARRTFLDLLRDHPESELRPQATYQTAKTFGLPVPADDENLERGVRYLRDLVRDGNGERSLLGDAALGIGLSYAHRGKDEEAVRAFRDLVEKFGGEPDVKEVALAWVRIGDARFRQRRLEDAVTAWKKFLAGFPAHSEWRSTQRKLVDVEYTVGFDAFRDERYDEAATSWGTFLERYPLDERSPGIYVLIGKIHYEKERFDEAVVTWRRVVSKYPGTEEASEAQYWVGVTLEK
ncbi:MAG: tetratricopeptide repeat protein, partial [Planctomycetota bacterium]|nr:tetratricopeptide repeat protein [Planctomycetota bacterium]